MLDVLIVGAGISGISAACYLEKESPEANYRIIEARDNAGGTWDLFRYPGIRSDSDMHTFGFAFKPWTDPKVLADGESIRAYVNEVIDDYDIKSNIQFGHKVVSADWQSASDSWLVVVKDQSGIETQIETRLLFMCAGYYDYKEGYTPDLPGLENFKGQVVHPQQWPEDLDYKNKKVAVIGSGATAVTLVPAMAGDAEKVTMVQRSPTYVASRPKQDVISNILNALLPAQWAYDAVRWKNIRLQNFFYSRARKSPKKMKEFLLKQVRKHLPENFDVAKHFTPRYDPWDQRVCLVPEGDLFTAIKNGSADVITGTINSITDTGILMDDGTGVEADVVVTATGLNLQLMGGTTFSLDGEAIDFSQRFFYQGMMFSGIPNLVQTFGYINASWTLRADLNSFYVTRLVNYMKDNNKTRVSAELLGDDKTMQPENPFPDFQPGYMQRGLHTFPKQGDHAPWQNTQNYLLDKKLLGEAKLEDGVLQFS
ncbi:MAG: flavin-containing monooxygenase [Pseudohongiellaceae bacterium]